MEGRRQGIHCRSCERKKFHRLEESRQQAKDPKSSSFLLLKLLRTETPFHYEWYWLSAVGTRLVSPIPASARFAKRHQCRKGSRSAESTHSDSLVPTPLESRRDVGPSVRFCVSLRHRHQNPRGVMKRFPLRNQPLALRKSLGNRYIPPSKFAENRGPLC